MMCNNALKHVQQPNDVSCGLAAISMVSRVPLPKVIEIAKTTFDHDPLDIGMTSFDICNLLVRLGVRYTPKWPGLISFGNVYLASVPSLNAMGRLHHVVLDVIDTFEVLDPNRGRANRKYYITGRKPNGDLEHELTTYANVVQIHGPWDK